MIKNRWFWTAITIAVLTLGFLLELMPLFMGEHDSKELSSNAMTAKEVSLSPWLNTYPPDARDNKVWGVEKKNISAASINKKQVTTQKKRRVVSLKKVKGRQVLCLDKICFIFLGINNINNETYAAFMHDSNRQKQKSSERRLYNKVNLGINSKNTNQDEAFMNYTDRKRVKQSENSYAYVNKIIKFKEGDMIDNLLSIEKLSLHGIHMRDIETDKTYTINLFITDLDKYKIDKGSMQ